MNRALWLIYVQNLPVFVCFTGGRVVLPLFALSQGATTADVGIILSLLYLMPALLSWPLGMLTDRIGARKVLATGSFLNAAFMAVPFFWHTMPAMCIGSVGIGIGLATANVVGQQMVGLLTKPEDRTRAFGTYSLIPGASNFIGPLLAGFSIDHLGFPVSSMVFAVLTFSSTVMMLAFGGILPRAKSGAAKHRGDLLYPLRGAKMRRILYLGSLSQVGVDAYISFMPIYAHGLGLSASAIGTSLSTLAVSVLVARLVMMPALKRWGEAGLMLFGFSCAVAAFLLLPLFESALALAMVSFLFGFFQGFTQPITTMLTFNSAPPGRSGESLGLRMTVNNATRVVSPAVFGAVARVFGMAPLFILGGLLMCLGGYLSQDRRLTAKSLPEKE